MDWRIYRDLSGILSAAILFLSAGGLRSADCNRNGLDDADEVRPAFSLAALEAYEAAPFPGLASVADLDRDGDLDLVVARQNPAHVAVLSNQGDGTYAMPAQIPLPTDSLARLAVGDLDGDRNLDILLDHAGPQFLRGDGKLSFEPPRQLLINPEVGPFLAAEDLDGDGLADLVVMPGSVLLNDGSGTFLQSRVLPFYVGAVDATVSTAATGDLDGDSRPDLVCAFRDGDGRSGLTVLLNFGDAIFKPPVVAPVDVLFFHLLVVDLDGDGDRDVVADRSRAPTGPIFMLPNQGGGRLGPPVKVDFLANRALAAGDIDGDFDPDVIVAHPSGITVHRQGRDGSFPGAIPSFPLSSSATPTSLAAGDLDGDGDLDLAAAPIPGGGIAILLNQGNGRLADAAKYAAGTSPASLVIEDLNGDGHLDLAVANSGSDDVTVLINRRDGTFRFGGNFAAGNQPASMVAADLDRDGDLDLAVANTASSSVSLLFNQGNGLFRGGPSLAAAEPTHVAAADLDRDGRTDLLVGNRFYDDISIFLNGGDGRFNDPVNFPVGGPPRSLLTGDLDRDGDQDVVVGDTVFVSHGDGTFETVLDMGPRSPQGVSRELADLDGDGNLDVVFLDGLLSVLLNRGGLKLLNGGSYDAGNSPSTLSILDLDGDRDLDLAVANPGSVTVLLNRTAPPAAPDCNRNGIPDACDIASGASRDRDRDGQPDECKAAAYRRGDASADGKHNLTDPIFILSALFLGGEQPSCARAADVDDSGSLGLTDPIQLIGYLFLAGPAPGEPFAACGVDPTPDSLTCESYPGCG